MWPQPKPSALPHLLVVAVLVLAAHKAGVVSIAERAPTQRAAAAPVPSRSARADIPPEMLARYRTAGRGETWDGIAAWAVLAGIGSIESDHGRSSAPGVRSGVNRFGCCAGPMQFNLTNGPPSTWDRWGHGSPYDPDDAVTAAATKLRADGARHDLDAAVYAYNHSWAYVRQVKRLARSYQDRRS